jgi:hypothetical protein
MTKIARIDDTDYDVEGNHPCRRCARTGQFITYIENGVPKGPGGICFRCGGKGYHTQEDRRRNNGYDCRGFYQDRSGAHHDGVAEFKRGSLNDLI